MQNFKEMLQIASDVDIPVLLLGESGSGKEVAARALHERSARHTGPFIALNCGAIPANLTESILEGAEKGSYTGALNSQMGVVRAAARGTLFLDEIGDFPLESQARLLRILQEKAVLPIGAYREIPVDFRLVCATHRDLASLVRQGLFREDLYFRLNAFPIHLPPLRNRKEEFQEIADSVWEELNLTFGLKKEPLTSEEIKLLKKYRWPGNVRQLKNVLQRYYLLKQFSHTLESVLNEEFPFRTNGLAETCRKRCFPSLAELEKTLLECDNNKTRAAQKLGISRGSLCYRLRMLSLATASS